MNILFYVAYQDSQKAKQRESKLANAMKAGCEAHGDTVDMKPAHEFDGYVEGYDMAVVMGIKGISPDVFGAWIRAGKQVMLIDKGFTRPKLNVPPRGDAAYWRICINDCQPNSYAFTKKRPDDRISKIELELKPFRENGDQIVLAGSSDKYYRFFGIDDPTEYHKGLVKQIRKRIGLTRDIWYRPKPSFFRRHKEDCPTIDGTMFRKPITRLYTDLLGAHCLITHGSNACFDSIVGGVPVVNMGLCASEPISENDISNIGDPFVPTEEQRWQWLCDVAYCQFTADEIRTGVAWSILSEETPKVLLNSSVYKHMEESEQLIAQYRYLHKLRKYYRGQSIRNHKAEIKELITQTGARTILDYGSGKGWQYSKASLHKGWGVPEPWCYDPAVEGLDVKPTATFDAVVCSDVLEHIPEYKIQEVLDELVAFGTKFVWMSIALYTATKRLPDGRNAHVTVRPAEWWQERIDKAIAKSPTSPIVVPRYSERTWQADRERDILDDEAITTGTRP